MFVLFLVCFYGYHINKVYGFTFFPDEFGYWAYAARAAGYDWSDIVSLGSYYSYGYSLVLFPVFYLCTDPVTAYRAAVTLNFILLGAVYFMLLRLVRRICGVGEGRSCFCAAVAVFYPCWLFYAKSTMVEVMLVAAYAAVCFLIWEYLEDNRWTTLLLAVLSLVYIHFLHMRAVAVMIAGMLVLLRSFRGRSRSAVRCVLVVLTGAFLLAGGFVLKEWLQGSLYMTADAALMHINDYSGQFEKVRYLFTMEGIRSFMEGLAGKVLYLGLASFGLAYWGIWYAVRRIRESVRGQGLFFWFILSSTAGELLINGVYNIRPIRVDSVIYGRYHEFVLPVLMAFGMHELMRTAHLWTGTAGAALAQFPLAAAAVGCVERLGLTDIHGYVAVGMSYVEDAAHAQPSAFIWKAYCAGILLTFLTALVAWAARRRKGHDFLLVSIIVMEFLLSVRLSGLYIDEAARASCRDLTVAGKIQELRAEDPERRIVYLREDEWAFISILQFMMRDEQIDILPVRDSIADYPPEELDTRDILVLFFESGSTKEAEERYASHLLNGHFYIYYNR